MKKKLNWLLMAAVMLVGSMTVTSCKDDDDEEKELTEEQKEEQAAQLTSEYETFWSVVGQLTTVDERPEDWKNATFEPTYGEQDEENALTRVRVVDNLDEAARLYSYIVNIDALDGETSSHTFENPLVGTLKYTRSTDGKSLATVDVNIKQMPHLQKIVYKTIDQLGTNTINNGSFKGSAYYRFGDVVAKMNGDVKEYWICVRPAYSRQGKGNTHWITLSPLQEKKKTLFHHPGTNGVEYYLPNNLGDDKENELNFAEMLYAVLNPNQWEENLRASAKLDMFNGFKHTNIDYENNWFWKRVAEGWKEADVMRKCFGGMTMDELRKSINDDGLTLIYDDCSWWTSVSWSPSIYTRIYSGTNLTKMKKKTYSKNVKLNIDVDFSEDYRAKFEKNALFFGDSKPRWCIRHATGEDLGGHDDPKRKLDGEIEEIYVYNNMFVCDKDLSKDDEIIKDWVEDNADRGYFVPGEVVKDNNGCMWACVQSSTANYRYSYFISFDSKALRSGNEMLANLPSRNLAIQILFDLIASYTNYIKNKEMDHGAVQNTYLAYKQQIGLDMDFVPAVYTSWSDAHHANIYNIVANALYKDDDGTISVVRLMNDGSANEAGAARSADFRAYDSYTKNLSTAARKMKLNDLFDLNTVNSYNDDAKWQTWKLVKMPFASDNIQSIPTVKRTQAITETSHDKWIYNLPNSNYQDFVQTKAGLNMYNEPVLAFAVKRVKDDGSDQVRFDDGTIFRIYRKYSKDNYIYDNMYEDPSVQTYNAMILKGGEGMYLNDKPYTFGIQNAR